MIVFRAIVEKKIEKKLEMGIFRIGQANVFDGSIFRFDCMIIVLMVLQEGSNRHVVRLGCEEDVTMRL